MIHFVEIDSSRGPVYDVLNEIEPGRGIIACDLCCLGRGVKIDGVECADVDCLVPGYTDRIANSGFFTNKLRRRPKSNISKAEPHHA